MVFIYFVPYDIRDNYGFSATSKLIFKKEMLVGALSTVVCFLSSLVSLFTVSMKRDLVARLVKKVSEINEVLSKHEDQEMELKRIKYVAVTKICILIISVIICTDLAVVSWEHLLDTCKKFLCGFPLFFHNSISPFVGIYVICSSEPC